nr:hypothetical protein [Tanacetum cinerariifolium]
MIVESIHIRFDEIKEVSETSVANNTSGLVPQRQKALDYDNPDPVPQRQDVCSSTDSTSAPSTHTNVHAKENNNDQAEEGEQLQDDEFTILSVHRHKKKLSLPHTTLVIQMFQPSINQ